MELDLSPILNAVGILGGMGALFGLILGIASKVFFVEQDERITLVRECLPGANCGGCGYAGCDALAEAIVQGTAPINGCPVGGSAAVAQIAPIMGNEVVETERMVALVACKGSSDLCAPKYDYYGAEDCREAAAIHDGPKGCQYGCLGFGTCVNVCQFNAIFINSKGIAEVDPEKCTSCGACIKACPKSVLSLAPYSKNIEISCNSKDKGRSVRDICSTGCITCGICAKQCPENAIAINGSTNLPEVDHAKCNGCGTCMEKCPQKTIVESKKGKESKEKLSA